jgi:hypothetical protein
LIGNKRWYGQQTEQCGDGLSNHPIDLPDAPRNPVPRLFERRPSRGSI